MDPSLMASAFATLAHDWRLLPYPPPGVTLRPGEVASRCSRCDLLYVGEPHRRPMTPCQGRAL